MSMTDHILRTDFHSFMRHNFRYHHGEKLGSQPYIQYLSARIDQLLAGSQKRLIINLPPRHLKTFIASVSLPAFFLGHHPEKEVMIVAYSHPLAESISRDIRTTMRSEWYRRIFKTRISADHSRATDFGTTKHGRVFASSIDGSLTGHGADLLICDDLLDIGQSDNPERIAKVNYRFDTKVISRLNNPSEDRVLVIAHRLNQNDLTGHLAERREWKKFALPFIAVKTKRYEIGEFEWQRKKGDLLRPKAFSKLEIDRKKTLPDFDGLYQQDPGRSDSWRIKGTYFEFFDYRPANRPVVLSIDTGRKPGAMNSYSVIQVWSPDRRDHYLIDQWRAQCAYLDLRNRCLRFINMYRPSAIVIEGAAMGLQLKYTIEQRHPSLLIKEVNPTRSKFQRLAPHISKFRNHHIHILKDAAWAEEYIAELMDFPAGNFDDQVDATTQYLDFMDQAPQLVMPEPRALGCGVDSQGRRLPGRSGPPDFQTKGAVLLLGSRRGWPRW